MQPGLFVGENILSYASVNKVTTRAAVVKLSLREKFPQLLPWQLKIRLFGGRHLEVVTTAGWQDESCSSFSLLFPQPSMPPLCSGNKHRGNFGKAAWVALERDAVGGDVKETPVFTPNTPVEPQQYLQMSPISSAYRLMFSNLSAWFMCVFM